MTRIKPGLRSRFIAASLLLVSICSAGYFLSVAMLVEFMEAELRDTTLLGQLEQFAQAYERDSSAVGPHDAGLSSYVLPPGADSATLPEGLRDLPPGAFDDQIVDGREVAIARRDVNGAHLYVVLDMHSVEGLESRLTVLAVLSILISWVAAAAMASWLAGKVLRPVIELAQRVRQLEPTTNHAPLTPHFEDPETRLIAAAFDRFMLRMDAFLVREQAFTEDASHELRTPLSVIGSSAQLLAEDATLSTSARQHVQRVLRSAEQMQMLIEALLFLSREEGGPPSDSLALDELVSEVAQLHQALARSRKLEFVLHTVPFHINAPPGMARCVINNLIVNALHFTEQGLVEVFVEPSKLIVQDSGLGIAPSDLGHIFERRFRGSHSRGLGIGLYLVKRICDRLGWRIQVHSESGVGTRFSVEFPAE